MALARLNYIFFIPNPTTSATGDFDEAVGDLVRALETNITWNPLPHDVAVIVTASEDKTARLWRVFANTQALVNAAKASLRRCLTPEQRTAHFLSVAPPTWCIERRLRPYHNDEWLRGSPSERAGSPPAPEPPLPKAGE